MRRILKTRSWVAGALLIVTLAAFLGGQFPVLAAPQDAQSAPRSAPAQQLPHAAEPVAVLRGTYPAGTILNSLDLGPRAETAAATATGGPMRVGVGRAIPADLAAEVEAGNLFWRSVGTGEAAAFTVTSSGAAALRLALRVTSLPPSGEIRFFDSADSPKVFGPFSLDDIRAAETDGDTGPAGLFWSPVIEGETVGVEIFLPVAGQRAGVQFQVPYVSHLTVFPGSTQRVSAEALGDASSCEIDVACNSAWTNTAAAVARISFIEGIDSFTCSGTLLTDRPNTHAPYFLTANHCVSSSSVAATVNSFWFFQKTTCGGSTVSPVTQLTKGATLLAHGIDYSFLLLKDPAPAGATFAAWDPTPMTVGRSVVGIHHPAGDAKKISAGVINAITNFNFPGVGQAVYIDVDWTSGQTEGGSSGSGLFYSDSSGQYLVGTLTGSNTSCTFGTSKYIQFAAIYPFISAWLEGTVASKAVMVSPTPGTKFGGQTVTFDWNAGFKATAYWLDVGTAPGVGDMFGANVGLATEQTVINLPVLSETVYVRLWTLLDGVWQFNDYSYTAFSIAALTSNSTQLPCSSTVQFTWSSAAGATAYWLDVGTAPGSGTVFGKNVGTSTSAIVTGIPLGSLMYARLWTRLGGNWYFRDYSYPLPTCSTAYMISPASGTTLGGSSVTFTWQAASSANAYELYVGSFPGVGDLAFVNTGLATSVTVNNLPLTGVPIYARLGTLGSSGWITRDYTYVAGSLAAINLPVPGTSLCGSPTFRWGAVAGALDYSLDVGTSVGAGNILSTNLGLALSKTVSGIPSSGTVFVRLTTHLTGGSFFVDYSYPAGQTCKATMAMPAAGSTLTGSGVYFRWSPGLDATAYWLDVGTTFGQGNIFGQNVGLETEQFVSGLPTDGRQVFVRLWSLVGGTWQVNDYSYTASPPLTKAVMISPAPGSVLPSSFFQFKWNAGAGATEYWLDVDTVGPGQGRWFARNVGLATTTQLTSPGAGLSIPVNGHVYVRLWTKLAGTWVFDDYTYTGGTSDKVALASPTPGSILTGTGTTFTFNALTVGGWLDVGSAPGVGDIFGQPVTGISQFVSGLPNDGRLVYVRLWTKNISGQWNFNDYTFVASPPRTKAVLIAPVPGSMLFGSNAVFSWDPGAGAEAYWLDVGTAPGVGNYFAADVGLATARTVTNLPTNGTAIYVRLWTKLDGTWQFNDYSFTALH